MSNTVSTHHLIFVEQVQIMQQLSKGRCVQERRLHKYACRTVSDSLDISNLALLWKLCVYAWNFCYNAVELAHLLTWDTFCCKKEEAATTLWVGVGNWHAQIERGLVVANLPVSKELSAVLNCDLLITLPTSMNLGAYSCCWISQQQCLMDNS